MERLEPSMRSRSPGSGRDVWTRAFTARLACGDCHRLRRTRGPSSWWCLSLGERQSRTPDPSACFAVVAELLQGARLRNWGAAKVAKLEEAIRTVTIIPYDIGVCREWALLSDAKNPDGSSRTFENNDRWIAACAIHHDVALITHNRQHFEGIPRLRLISEAPP